MKCQHPEEIGHCLRYIFLFISSFYLYAGWLDLNVSYVGLVMCRHQRPLFDLAAVQNPASWLARVDARDCLHVKNGYGKIKQANQHLFYHKVKT
jgi:hypothetical protein